MGNDGEPPFSARRHASRQLIADRHDRRCAESKRNVGAMVRLGVRRPGDDLKRDLHQGTFDADERAIALGVRLLTTAALLSLTAE